MNVWIHNQNLKLPLKLFYSPTWDGYEGEHLELIKQNKRVCICLRGVIARNHFACKEKHISKEIDFQF